MLRWIILLTTALLSMDLAMAVDVCPSTVSINVKTNMGSGPIKAELRSGTRPGSGLVATETGTAPMFRQFSNVCPGRYFFAIDTGDDKDIKVTRYFNVVVTETPDGYSYSNPQIEIFVRRVKRRNSADSIGSVRRRDL